MTPLTATITRCAQGQALVELDSQPFNGLALRPAELRALAHQLAALAATACELPTGGKHWRAHKVSMGALPAMTAMPADNDAARLEVYNRMIWQEYDGSNFEQLAVRHGITEARVRAILATEFVLATVRGQA